MGSLLKSYFGNGKNLILKLIIHLKRRIGAIGPLKIQKNLQKFFNYEFRFNLRYRLCENF